MFDNVHCGHSQARAINHTANFAIELDIAEARPPGFALRRRFFLHISQLRQVSMAEEAIIVQHHFAVHS
jgi:hypothetical protein